MKPNYLLHYKNLKIFQGKNTFRFSLDSVLLSHFVTIQYRTKNILDIGTGNAPIPLILSTKTSAKIVGIELQKESATLARQSILHNHLENQISIVEEDIRKWYKKQESDLFDVIISNPPFFKLKETSYINQTDERTLARHEKTLTIEDICIISKKLLKNNGRLALVYRPERFIEIIECMKKNNIEPKKIRFVYPYRGKSANMLLIEGTKNGNSGLEVLDPIYVYENGTYTKELLQYFGEEL